MSLQIYINTAQFHLHLLTVIWDGLATLGLTLALFPQFQSIMHLHGIVMWLVAGLSLTGICAQIVVIGFVPTGVLTLHWACGFIVLFLVVVICLLGKLLRIKKESSKASPKTIFILTKMHGILGFLIYIVAQIGLLSKWWVLDMTTFIGLTAYQGIFLIGRTLYFLLQPTIRSKGKDYQTESSEIQGIRKIKNQNDMAIYSNNYFVFGDYIYSLTQVLHSHPGGVKIIEAIRGREVDRFLYGEEPLQILSNEHSRVEHSRWALGLAGPPLAKFERYNPYPSMSDSNECVVESLRELNKASSVYLLQLSSKGAQFQYAGFQSVSQLGQYFTVTINDRKTRLYTSVNCMSTSNRQLMAEIAEQMNDNFGDNLLERNEIEMHDYTQSPSTNSRSMEKGSTHDKTLPLLIKRYDDGFFTSDIISQKFQGNVRVSRSMGAGLALQEKKPGKIIILAGGTGIYPFIDTIDILYKKALVDTNHPKKQKILSLNPAVKDPWLNQFTFSVTGSFQSSTDVHPMTLYQLSELNRLLPGKFTCTLKVSDLMNSFAKSYPSLKITRERFEEYLSKQLGSANKIRDISQIYMCGPTRMTVSVLETLEQYSVSSDKYKII